MKNHSIKNTFFYMGLTAEQYRQVRPKIAERNRKNLTTMSLVMAAFALVMLLMEFLVLHQDFQWLYGAVFMAGLLIHFLSRVTKKTTTILVLSYAALAFLFSYAIVLTASPANYNVPATSIIVYMVLFPMLVPDVAWRMLALEGAFETIYLFVSHTVKSHSVFLSDISNSMVLVPLGFVVFMAVSNTLARQIYDSLHIHKIENHMIMSLTDIVEDRDESTGSHVRGTVGHVEQILLRLREQPKYSAIITSEYVEYVVRAAPLHDIGKIKIPDAILKKPGRLTDEEFDIMKKHAEYGAEMIEKILDELRDERLTTIAYNIAYYHHERIDGKGYPSGAAGEAIPLEARIMAVADVYDALVSKRVYKEPFPQEKALQIMREGRGTQFDPDVLDAFLACIEERPEEKIG